MDRGKRRGLATRILPAVLAAALLGVLAFGTGCSASDDQPATSSSSSCTVFAAASLTNVLPQLESAFKQAHPEYSSVKFVNNFQGTDTLVMQLQQGSRADVFVGASTKYGDQLVNDGLIDEPVNFCQNKLIVIVPRDNPGTISSLADLAKEGEKISMGNSSVPVGIYTRKVLRKLGTDYGAAYSSRVMNNVVTQETKVTAVTSGVLIGEVDAGFVYVSDAYAAVDKVTRIDIPNKYQSDPLPTYPIAVVKANRSGAVAQQFIDFVLSEQGQAILQEFDFLPKP